MTFALINIETMEVKQQFSDLPPFVAWPNGDQSHPASPGIERAGYRFVSVVHSPECPGEFYSVSDLKPTLSQDTLTYQRVWTPQDLASVKAILKSRIDDRAEEERKKYLTPGSGQALTYQEKISEARACLSDKAPTADAYPMLAATIPEDGIDVVAVAQSVLSAYQYFVKAGSIIEATRKKAKASIEAAINVDHAVLSFNSVTWDGQ